MPPNTASSGAEQGLTTRSPPLLTSTITGTTSATATLPSPVRVAGGVMWEKAVAAEAEAEAAGSGNQAQVVGRLPSGDLTQPVQQDGRVGAERGAGLGRI